MLLFLLLVKYPYSLTPGGVKADYYASHDFPAWVDMRFAGEIYWVHTTIRKGEGLTHDGRRARCGNHVRTGLPPGARKLPPVFKFLVPILNNPLPDPAYEPPAIGLNPPPLVPPLLTPTPNNPGAPILTGPIPMLPVLIPSCKQRPNSKCKKKNPGTAPTPEPSTWVLISAGLALVAIKLRIARTRAHKRASSAAR